MTGPDDDVQPETTARLRDDIDRGAGADKVAWTDPAAAPLGTDAEAAGAPPGRDQVARAQADETRARPGPKRPHGSRAGPLILILGVVIAIAVALALFWNG